MCAVGVQHHFKLLSEVAYLGIFQFFLEQVLLTAGFHSKMIFGTNLLLQVLLMQNHLMILK